MTQAMPGKMDAWDTLVQCVGLVFSPQVVNTAIVSETQRVNTEQMLKANAERDKRMLEANAERDKKQRELQTAQMWLQYLQHKENLEFTEDQNTLNRQLQAELARLNREFQAEEGRLNRQLQAELARLNQEFQAKEGRLNREHTAKLELFRASIQKWALEQQRELQLQLKALDAELARELRIYDRETAIKVIHEQKRQNNSPIWLVAEDLINSNPNQILIPLRVFFSPPTLRYDRSGDAADATRGFPEMEQGLARELRNLFEKYSAQGRPIEFLAGAWTSKFFHSEAATKAIFRGLKTEPAMILESAVEGDIFDLNFCYWGLAWENYRYKSAISLSWREALYEFAKLRALRWKEKRDAYITSGRNPEEFDKRYGTETVKRFVSNLEIFQREQQCIEEGDDPTEIERPYSIHQNDYNELRKFLATCHCLFAGLLADEYFLVHVHPNVRLRPLLPQFLLELMKGIPQQKMQKLVEIVVSFYQTLYELLEKDESGWIPELKLDLAQSLMHLPNQFGAKKQVNESIQSWLQLHGVSQQSGIEPLEALNSALAIEDLAYVEKLNQCLASLGYEQRLSVMDACYQRGMNRCQQEDYEAAISDFDQAIQLNPSWAEAYYKRGLAYAKLEQYQKAIADYTQALQINDTWAEVYKNRGDAHYELGNYEQAIADYNQALRINPDLTEARRNRDIAQGVQKELERKQQEEEEQAKIEAERRRTEEEEGKKLISSVTGVDYRKLRDLLAAGKWKEADEETCRYVTVKTLHKTCCKNISIIDKLWIEYSNGRFGFSVQKQIWESNNFMSSSRSPGKRGRGFARCVGWLTDQWISEPNFYSIHNAPDGHLPYFLCNGNFWSQSSGESVDSYMFSLVSKLTECETWYLSQDPKNLIFTPPSSPLQCRAIGLIKGRYEPSRKFTNKGKLVTPDGTEIDAVIFKGLINKAKRIDLTKEQLWVVYPRTRNPIRKPRNGLGKPHEQITPLLHVQLKRVREPHYINNSPGTPRVVSQSQSISTKPDYFSIRGEVIYQDPRESYVMVQIPIAPRKSSKNVKENANFKLRLEGALPSNAVGFFWDFQVERERQSLVIRHSQKVARVSKY